MNVSAKVQRIIDWRESMATLDEGMFFDIVRMYLGEIKTPYNKQKLIEGLSSFLRKEENRKTLVCLLGSRDLKILTLVKSIRGCSEKKIRAFLEENEQLSPLDLGEHITNLQERLILFSFANKDSGETELRINPLLEDDLAPLLQTEVLFEKEAQPQAASSPSAACLQTDVASQADAALQTDVASQTDATLQTAAALQTDAALQTGATPQTAAPCALSPQFLAGFFSFVICHPDLCKNDGSLKKHSIEEMQEIFGGAEKSALEKLTRAFLNLSVLCATERGTVVDHSRLEQFALLPEKAQYLYAATAAVAHFPRKTMQATAQIFYNALCKIPGDGCTLSQLTQLYLLQKENDPAEETGRFGRMLFAAQGADGENISDGSLVKAFAKAAEAFDILRVCSHDADGAPCYGLSPLFKTAAPEESDGAYRPDGGQKKVLSVDSAFSVTLLPGLSLLELLPLLPLLQIKHYDTAAVFEVNRRCAIRAFDSGLTPQKIEQLFQTYSPYKIQQNIHVCLEEWFSSYTSASLYKGYVLKVKEENAQLIQLVKNNPQLSPYIREELSAGVFLLSFADDSQANAVIAKSGMDFIGGMKVAQEKKNALSFLPLKEPVRTDGERKKSASAPAPSVNKEKQKAILESLKAELSSMRLTADQREALLDRINRKIVLSKSQLVGGSVRFEKVEAGGMDYTGKIHVIERALQNGGILEIELEGGSSVAGRPVELNKKTMGAKLSLERASDGKTVSIPVSSAVRIKKTRRLLNLD